MLRGVVPFSKRIAREYGDVPEDIVVDEAEPVIVRPQRGGVAGPAEKELQEEAEE